MTLPFSCGLFVQAAALSLLPAQSLELRSGEVMIGHVVVLGAESVQVAVAFPEPGTRSIAGDAIEPRSLYSLLAARISPDDARAHLDLAARCRELGLYAPAIAEAREAARFDRDLTEASTRIIAELREASAADLRHQAEVAQADNRVGSARLAAHAVVHECRDTAASERAQQQLRQLAAGGGGNLREASAIEFEKAINTARKEFARVAEETEVPAHGAMQDQRGLQRGIARLEQMSKAIGDLTAVGGDAKVVDRLSTTPAELLAQLVDAHLALGSYYLQRRALPEAEESCNTACELDPEHKHLHRLLELILQAKLVSGWHK